MQDKELSEQATKAACYAGIDVSKDWLDICVLPAGETRRMANSAAGIRALGQWLKARRPRAIVLEATGKWHRPAHRSLHAGGLPVAVADPYRVRQFAKASGIVAKTDRLDARVLARFAEVMAPPVRPPAPQAREDLAELVTAREAAVAEQTALKNQRVAAASAFLRAQLGRRINALDRHVAALERECLRCAQADDAMARRFEILVSIPAIGPITALTLIAELGELGACTSKQIGQLTGLAPIANESGQRQGVRVIRGGRPKLRRVLYLAAIAAARCNPDLAALYKRLRASAKPPKLALVAVARKLAILANTLISQGRNWTPKPPKHA
jgi:transposase